MTAHFQNRDRKTRKQCEQRRGSVYLVILVTVAAVTTMVLVGTTLRMTTTERYRMTDEQTRARQAARSSMEATLQLCTDYDTFLVLADSGEMIPAMKIGSASMTATVIDSDSGKKVTDETRNITVTATGETNDARQIIKFDAEYMDPSLELLIEKGATSYWTLGENKDSTVAIDDISDIDGTYMKPSHVGKESFLDGGIAPEIKDETDYVELPHDSSFEQSEGTVSVWARFNDMDGANMQAIFSKEDADSVDFDIAMFVQNEDLKFSINSKYSFLDRFYGYNIASKNDKDWHHFAYSFGPGGTRVYVDGVRVIYDPTYILGLSYNYAGYSERNNERWWLGVRRYDSDPTDPIDGAIARFAFIPDQLGDSEIAELMESQLESVKFVPIQGSFARVVE